MLRWSPLVRKNQNDLAIPPVLGVPNVTTHNSGHCSIWPLCIFPRIDWGRAGRGERARSKSHLAGRSQDLR